MMAAGMIYKYVVKNRNSGLIVTGAVTGAASEVSESSTSSQSVRMISIYICGEVNNPGIYELESGSLLNDAVIAAGGFTDEAAADRLNLVYQFNSNMSVYIPGYDNLEEGGSVIMMNGGSSAAGSLQGPVNINTASADELKTLPGIGDITAESIIAYRQERPFQSVEDIMNVSGIGEAKFDKIRGLICV